MPSRPPGWRVLAASEGPVPRFRSRLRRAALRPVSGGKSGAAAPGMAYPSVSVWIQNTTLVVLHVGSADRQNPALPDRREGRETSGLARRTVAAQR